jgi:hypothetical protein
MLLRRESKFNARGGNKIRREIKTRHLHLCVLGSHTSTHFVSNIAHVKHVHSFILLFSPLQCNFWSCGCTRCTWTMYFISPTQQPLSVGCSIMNPIHLTGHMGPTCQWQIDSRHLIADMVVTRCSRAEVPLMWSDEWLWAEVELTWQNCPFLYY